MLSWIGILVLVAAALYLVLAQSPGEAIGVSGDDFARLASGVALLIVIGGSMMLGRRGSAGEAVKQAVVWLGIALALVVLYSYRGEFAGLANRVAGELLPGRPQIIRTTGTGAGDGVVAVTAGQDGHFQIDALVDGTHVSMIADTGASTVVLTDRDARRVGIDVAGLRFVVPVSTANGTTYAAPVTLQQVSVGGIAVHNVQGLVSKPDVLRTSLLGMSYLTRVGSFKLSGSQLILRE